MPYFGEAESGAFSDHELELGIAEPAPREANVKRVADGGADACLTSVQQYLTARVLWGNLPARFVAVVGRRSSFGVLVPASSSIHEPADLSGRRVAGSADNPNVAQLLALLEDRGLAPPLLLKAGNRRAYPALAAGEVDAVTAFADKLPRARADAGVELRAVPFDLEVYTSGLVVADRVPDEVVDRLRHGLAAALTHQRSHPDTGLRGLKERFPDLDPAVALEGWSILEPYVFDAGTEPGSMSAEGWSATLALAGAVRQVWFEPTTVYRPSCVTS